MYKRQDKMRRLITWYEHTTHNDIHICQFSTNIMLVGIERVYIDRDVYKRQGEGSAPNAAAVATVSHPVKQGLIQALGVFMVIL